MGDCSPLKLPGEAETCHANAAIVGARCVVLVAGVNEQDGQPRVANAGAAATPYGVAMQDRLAGQKVGVYSAYDVIIPIEVGAVAVAHGTSVETDALGRVVPLGTSAGNTKRVGLCLADAAPGAQAKIKFRPSTA